MAALGISVASMTLATLANPLIRSKIVSIENAKEDLEKLERGLETIKGALLNAEKFEEEPAVKDWIKRVKDVLYDADDLLDQTAIDDELKKLNELGWDCTEIVDSSSTTPLIWEGCELTPEPVMPNGINTTLGSNVIDGVSIANGTADLGGTNDSDSDVPMEDIGETGDSRTSDTEPVPQATELGTRQRRVRAAIQERISGKKFLIVLDDVWDDSRDKWDARMGIFGRGAKGSKLHTQWVQLDFIIYVACQRKSLGICSKE
ncbi:hypothetical protein V2J09_005383 [Rumex salicifolius]